MSEAFFNQPILNSPYEYPRRHWELDEDGQPRQVTERAVLESQAASLRAIAEARHSVNLMVYIWEPGEMSEQM